MDLLGIVYNPHDPVDLATYCIRSILCLAVGILCIRIAGRTTFSQLNALDIVVSVAVGSNLSRAMTGSPLLPTLGASLALVSLHRGLAAAVIRWPGLGALTHGQPFVVIRDGVIDRAAQTKHRISDDELQEAIRLGGAFEASDVRLAVLENGGRISIVRYGGDAKGVLR